MPLPFRWDGHSNGGGLRMGMNETDAGHGDHSFISGHQVGISHNASYLALIVFGSWMGFMHVITGPDHISAIVTLSVGGTWRAFWLGVRWGFGHSLGLLIMFVVILSAGGGIPGGQVAEWLVGFLMVALGVYGLHQTHTVWKDGKTTHTRIAKEQQDNILSLPASEPHLNGNGDVISYHKEGESNGASHGSSHPSTYFQEISANPSTLRKVGEAGNEVHSSQSPKGPLSLYQGWSEPPNGGGRTTSLPSHRAQEGIPRGVENGVIDVNHGVQNCFCEGVESGEENGEGDVCFLPGDEVHGDEKHQGALLVREGERRAGREEGADEWMSKGRVQRIVAMRLLEKERLRKCGEKWGLGSGGCVGGLGGEEGGTRRGLSEALKQKFMALTVGILHGIAGPGGVLGVLPAVSLQNPTRSACYLGSFCTASMLAMGGFAGGSWELTARANIVVVPIHEGGNNDDDPMMTIMMRSGELTARAGSSFRVRIYLMGFSALLSTIIGILWVILVATGTLDEVLGHNH